MQLNDAIKLMSDDQIICWSRQFRYETTELLKELKQRRESALRPATKYLNVTPEQQFEHVKSELKEIEVEFKFGNTINLAMEIVDLQMSAETLLAVLPLDERERMVARRKVIQKNAARGYYESGESK